MVEFELKYKDGNIEKLTIPSGWRELTVSQWKELRLNYSGDVGVLLEILTGIPRATWISQSPETVDVALSSVHWLTEKSGGNLENIPFPETIEVGAKTVELPKDLGLETFGQKMLIDNEIRNLIGRINEGHREETLKQDILSPISLVDYIAAVYLQKWLTGTSEFDAGHLNKAIEIVNGMPIIVIYPIASFFLKKSIDSLNLGQKLTRADRRQMIKKKSQGEKKRA